MLTDMYTTNTELMKRHDGLSTPTPTQPWRYQEPSTSTTGTMPRASARAHNNTEQTKHNYNNKNPEKHCKHTPRGTRHTNNKSNASNNNNANNYCRCA